MRVRDAAWTTGLGTAAAAVVIGAHLASDAVADVMRERDAAVAEAARLRSRPPVAAPPATPGPTPRPEPSPSDDEDQAPGRLPVRVPLGALPCDIAVIGGSP